MNLTDCLGFLDTHRVGVLAVLQPSGEPHAAVMHFSVNPAGPELYFSTDRNSVKVSGLGQQDAAAFATGWSEEDWTTIQLRGTLRAAVSSELESIHARHYKKHPQSEAFRDDPDTVFLILRPTWLRYSDLSVLPAIIEEYDLD